MQQKKDLVANAKKLYRNLHFLSREFPKASLSYTYLNSYPPSLCTVMNHCDFRSYVYARWLCS